MTDAGTGKPADMQLLLNTLKWDESTEKDKPRITRSDVLACLRLLTADAARAKVDTAGSGESVTGSAQVIKSGVSSITKWLTKISAGASVLTGLLAIVTGLITSIHRALAIPAIVALTGGGSLVLSAAAVAIALWVGGDPAQPNADTQRPAVPFPLLLTLSPLPTLLPVATKGHPELRTVAGLRHDRDEGLQLQLSDKDWIPVSQVEHWSSTP